MLQGNGFFARWLGGEILLQAVQELQKVVGGIGG